MSDVSIFLILVAGLIFAGHTIYTRRLLSSKSRDIPKTSTYIIAQDVKPYQFPALKIRTSTSTKMGMGLKRLDDSNWLTIDANYLPEHNHRIRLLSSCRLNVIECLPISLPACYEVLDLAVSFLTTRFPHQFTTSHNASGPVIHNHTTGETFPIGPHPHCRNPLEIAALLAMEDFNILIKDSTTGEYNLQASATLFPAGWKLQERIGTSLASLHAPVPGWNAKIGAHVNKYFDHLSPRTAMERTNLFIQTTSELFWDEPESTSREDIRVEEFMVRRERQTFTRLEKSGAVLFTVRTFMTPLVELGDEELRALRSQIWAWEEDIKEYKGWGLWGAKAEEWCESRLGKREERKVVGSGGIGKCPM